MKLWIVTLRATLLGVALSLTSASIAEPQNLGPRDPETVQAYWQFSVCLEANAPNKVAELLAKFVWSTSDIAKVGRLVRRNPACGLLPEGIDDPHKDLLRGALASAAFIRKHENNDLPDYSLVPHLDMVRQMLGRKPFRSMAEARQTVARLQWFTFGECVFRRAPGAVRNLLQTEPASLAENPIFEELNPQLKFCLPAPNGNEMRFTRLLLRGILGEAAYAVDLAASTEPPQKPSR